VLEVLAIFGSMKITFTASESNAIAMAPAGPWITALA
jgi:hypothetical protein